MRRARLRSLIVLFCVAFSSLHVRAQSAEIDSSIRDFRMLHVEGKRYGALLTTSGFFILREKDTLFRRLDDGINEFRFKYINQDGYTDILLDKSSHIPEMFDLLLYDPILKTFKPVRNFDRFPHPLPIPRTRLYDSYRKNGCADSDWISELFYIDRFKAVAIGQIYGDGCRADTSLSIEIYRLDSGKRHLLRRIKTASIGNKWDFIKHYWYRTYRRFL